MKNNKESSLNEEIKGVDNRYYCIEMGKVYSYTNDTPEDFSKALGAFEKTIASNPASAFILVSNTLNPDTIKDSANY